MPFTLDDYYPSDSVEAQSWLFVQKYTHTHHVTWKHVAYAARYDALLSFFRSHSTLRVPHSPTTGTTVSNEEDDMEHAARTRSDSAYSSSSILSASSHASSSTSFSTPSPASRISSLPIIDPQSIPAPSTSSSASSSSAPSSTPSNECREKLYTTPDSSNIIYIPPRTLGDLTDVLGRLAMSYMLTHISYLRESLKGSDFSTMKKIALGGLRDLMLRESTLQSTRLTSASPLENNNSNSTRSAERRSSTGSQERRNVGQDWLRLFDGRDEWDGKTPTLDLRGSPPALSRPQPLPRSNPYPRHEVHRGGLKV